jgi:putative hydrolase of the HAD superfamily
MTKPWRAVIFDLDDTLYPEAAYVRSGFRAVAAWVEEQGIERAGHGVGVGFSREQVLRELMALHQRGVRGDTFGRWLRMHAVAEEPSRVACMVAVYREHRPRIVPFPEVRDLLARLSRNVRLGLVSDGWLAVQQRKWAALRLEAWFQAVVFSDACGREFWKPHRRPFETALATLGVEGPEAVYIGDNPAKDFRGARSLGMATIRIRRPDGEYAALHPATPDDAPDVTVESHAALAAMLLPHGAQPSERRMQ